MTRRRYHRSKCCDCRRTLIRDEILYGDGLCHTCEERRENGARPESKRKAQPVTDTSRLYDPGDR